MRTSPVPNLRFALALGLVLPLAAAGGAAADPGGWVDPPAKPRAAKPGMDRPGAGKPDAAKAGPEAARAPAADPAQAAVADRSREDVGRREPTRAAASPAPRTQAPREAQAESRRATRAAEAPPRHLRPGRRLADTPAAGPGPGPVAEHADAARALAAQYLATVPAPGETMVGAASRFYGARVRFYGRPTTMAALIAEKRGFVQRWPERRYEARAFRTTCAPDGETCTVRALVDFRAASPARGAVSRGSSELVLEVSFAGGRPVIVAESGRVLRRGAQEAQTLAPTAG